MEEVILFEKLYKIKEQIYKDFNTINILNSKLQFISIQNKNRDLTNEISLKDEKFQKNIEILQSENRDLNSKINELVGSIEQKETENKKILANNNDIINQIDEQKKEINNLKEKINIKEYCSDLLNENSNYILNNLNYN